MNSRLQLKKDNPAPETPTNSRPYQQILANNYKPGFIDKTDTEFLKMSIDRELAEISKALFKTAERETEITEISEDAKKLVSEISTEWTISTDVNGKIAGVQLINGKDKKSEFNVLADVFRVSHDVEEGIAPFEIVDGKTKIKNAVVGSLYSDNWDGYANGWSITKNGAASFNDIFARGHLIGTSGLLTNMTIEEDCEIKGTAKIGDAQVDTLQIAGHAVTIPVAKEMFFTPSIQVDHSTAPDDIGCHVEGVEYTDGAEVIFIASGLTEGYGPTDFTIRMRIVKDGFIHEEKEVATSLEAAGWSSINTFMSVFTLPGPGTYSFYTLVGNRNSGGYYRIKMLTMSVFGAKR